MGGVQGEAEHGDVGGYTCGVCGDRDVGLGGVDGGDVVGGGFAYSVLVGVELRGVYGCGAEELFE